MLTPSKRLRTVALAVGAVLALLILYRGVSPEAWLSDLHPVGESPLNELVDETLLLNVSTPSNDTDWDLPLEPVDLDFPPTYREIRQKERTLPQHNLDLPLPEGQNGRYIKFTCQIQQLGWNNVLNELLLNTHLAYRSNRSYVFSDFVWKREYYPWPMEKAIEWPPHTPLSALISGPTVGGSWGKDDPAPRSISDTWWEVVCPKEKRKVINTRDYKPQLEDKNGREIFDTWLKAVRDDPSPCLEIEPATREEDPYPQVFDLWFWGTTRAADIWEEFRDAPVSTLLGPSDIVQEAIDTNLHLFNLPSVPEEAPTNLESLSPPISAARADPFSRVLAIHLRRGDFKEACLSLSNWNSTFYSWNLLPFLPDHFTPPPGGKPGKNTPENEKAYMEHCLPDDNGIREKIRNSRRDYLQAVNSGRGNSGEHQLDVLYLLTNDDSPWLDELKGILQRDDGWKLIRTSRDLELTQEGKDVAMAVDMELATKAAVFIGNGWSSFTSNIVHRRLVDKKIPMSIRFY